MESENKVPCPKPPRIDLGQVSNPDCLIWIPVHKAIYHYGYVHTWCPGMVPEYNSRWILMWTHLFSKHSHKNSGTVPVPKYLTLGHKTVLGSLEYAVSKQNIILCWCVGTSAQARSVNTAYMYAVMMSKSRFAIRLSVCWREVTAYMMCQFIAGTLLYL